MRMEDPNVRAGGLRLKRRIFLPNPNADKSKKDNANDKSKKNPPPIEKSNKNGNDSEDDDHRPVINIDDAREKVKARVAQRLALEKAVKEKEKADLQCRKEQQAKVLAYALKMMKRKSSTKRIRRLSNKGKAASKKNSHDCDPILNDVNLPNMSMGIDEPSPVSSNCDDDQANNDDDDVYENNDINHVPDSYNNYNHYNENLVDIDDHDNDDYGGEVDDGGFGFDDFMESAQETPWRDSPISNKPKKKNVGIVSKKDKGT